MSKNILHDKKYIDTFFIEKYVALWAYGYMNNIGQSEGLYRAVNELGFSCLNKEGNYKILDVGCGVGRTASDYALFFKRADIIGIDSSNLMINMAQRINKSDDQINLDMTRLGLGKMPIKSRCIENLIFRRITFDDFFSNTDKNTFDLITAVNFIDRVKDVRKSINAIFNLLKKDGIFILSSPLNFSNYQDWKKYSSLNSFSKLAQSIGFNIDIRFDNLIYQEILDARGAIEEYPTVVMRLIK
jgi:SAM-dependent methyltransferase